mmetsp:Transcript_6702/g.9354  ORF Transcript_6702/g.9354 Transcript_6702/m.9354 type:complete len:82 (+) Transcript_6702:63-308(+)
MDEKIKSKLTKELSPSYLEVFEEGGAKWTVKVTSTLFEGKSLINRHRMINNALIDEFTEIHALSIVAKTPQEWENLKNMIR